MSRQGDRLLQPGEAIDIWVVEAALGSGGMGSVYRCHNRTATRIMAAIKVLEGGLHRHPEAQKRFVREAEILHALDHPNIVKVRNVRSESEPPYIEMEFVAGESLDERLRRGPLPYPEAVQFMRQCADALAYLHDKAIRHRDIKPANLLVQKDGRVKLVDFGLAVEQDHTRITQAGMAFGTVSYAPPEWITPDTLDPAKWDIYALGVVFYELLTLRSPYGPGPGRLEDDALLDAVKSGAFLPPTTHNPDTPPELETIVMRALAKSRDDRFQTARDLSGAIARALIAKQELIDNTSVEGTLVHLVGRDMHMPTVPPDSEAAQPLTLAAVPLARTPSESSEHGTPGGTLAPRVVREVRHVAVVTLRIQGIDELESVQGRLAAKRSGNSIRATLDDIAYKQGARWSWESPSSARSVVGLLANPSRAAADSASLAIDVHEALAGASEDLPVALRAAIGIVRGIAAGERDDRGHLVNHSLQEPANQLADQLGGRTPFGKTWVAGGLYRLVRRDFRWGDAPSLEIVEAEKYQVPAQMRLYALQRPLTREERIAEIALAPNDLVGRDAEKADLHAAYHRATTPPATTTLPLSNETGPYPRFARGELVARAVVGEMGIGKTALCATFLAELPQGPEGPRVLHIECSPVKSELPLATLADLLRDATGLGLDHSIEEASTVFRGILGSAGRSAQGPRLISRLAEIATGKQLEHVDEDGANYRRDLVIAGVRYLLGAMVAVQPLVIVIDGLQWGDRASIELIQELLTRGDPLPILAVLVSRPDDRVMPFLEGVVRIELTGLSAEDQMRLVEARLGVRDGVAAVCGELVPRVAGNPFFLLEMVDALLERGTLEIVERSGGRHEIVRHDRPGDRGEALPSTLEQLIGDRLRELPNTEHDVVDWLAVAGGPLLESDLLALTRLADDEAITRLCARGLCDRKAGSVDFRHPLARDVAYFALDAPNRARMHRRLGEQLATTPLAQGLSAAIVARHLARGESPTPAAELYLEAAVAARNAHQAQLAQRYFQRVLTLLPVGDTRRMIAHEALEAIYRYLGRRRERRKHLGALRKLARDSGQARWAALALTRTARLDYDEGYLARGLPVAHKAAEVARITRQPALEVEAYTILSEILRDLGDTQGAINACERALKIAHRGNLAPRARAEVLRAKGKLLRYVGRVTEAVDAYAEAIAVFKAVGARRSEARAKNSLAFAMFVMEQFEDAIALGLDSISIDLAIGGRFQIAKTLSNIGQAYARLGDTPRGMAYLRRAREAHERYADQDSRADTLLCSAGILLEAGDMDAAHTLCGDAGALVAVTGSVYDTVHERILAALLARARGEPALAITHAAEARQNAEAQALVSFHIYATAIEGAARIDVGESPTGVLLATTALGSIEAVVGSEYGLEVRALCCEALSKGAPSIAADACLRAVAHVHRVACHVRDHRLRGLFYRRPLVARILAHAAKHGIEPDAAASEPSGPADSGPESKSIPSSGDQERDPGSQVHAPRDRERSGGLP